ncbi:helicase HerA domain-containing protein [Alcaligenes faecalis]|uniref:helicase HerA domain-containing protein n=1 Tax=Alcaligenes faecalis TaxID=511 RepID=UPI00208F1EF9|nr:DUF87 domain-containing protein [Alcaligenes faecalis]
MFGRHCAILGATGGGKSWTVARTVQETVKIGGKVILLDPTGEFHTFNTSVQSIHLGGQPVNDTDQRTFVSFPYWDLTEHDLFAIFQPSPGAQVPKLREALCSLKLNHILHDDSQTNYIKRGQSRREFNRLVKTNEAAIESAGARYRIRSLAR